MPRGLQLTGRPLRIVIAAGVIAVCATVAGVLAIGGASSETPVASPAALSEFTPIAGARAGAFGALERPRRTADALPANVPAEGLSSAKSVDGFRLALAREGASAFIAPGADGQSVCLLLVDPSGGPADWILNCPPADALAAGLQLLPLQRRPGEPAIYAGTVPDGIVAVVNGTQTLDVTNNVFMLTSPDGTRPSSLVYVSESGAKTRVQMLPNTPLPPTP